ncbi:conserved hypothetical protein [delta proteobacterium NaphS2]|nr:conserved hypothetical protein [delta proteobacterium NaphS2]
MGYESTRVIGKIVISGLLLWLALFMLKWGLAGRVAASGSYSAGMAQSMVAFPDVLARLGEEAWRKQNVSAAIGFFQKAVMGDPLKAGAWLGLAEAEKANGNRDVPRKILDYVHGLGKSTLRWTWSETLLAIDLEVYPMVWENLNRMIENKRRTADALQLADVILAAEPDAVGERLEARNLAPYMNWLIRWGRLDQALAVRALMARKGVGDPEADVRLSARLLGKKRVSEALSLGGTGAKGLTNPGFEADFTGGPFDWRFSRQGPGWKMERVAGVAGEGGYSLSIVFDGKKNVSFSHLHQVIPVEPGVSYRLTALWKGDGITTDQGPYLEIYGYDAKGLHVKGPMLLGTQDWGKVGIEFTAPDDCHAVVVRLRRLPSRKLDNRIEGTVWLDGFELADGGRVQLSGGRVQEER